MSGNCCQEFVAPFKPNDEREYSVWYAEGTNVRNLIGNIEFTPGGGVIVHRTRSKSGAIWIHVSTPIKIERYEPNGQVDSI